METWCWSFESSSAEASVSSNWLSPADLSTAAKSYLETVQIGAVFRYNQKEELELFNNEYSTL